MVVALTYRKKFDTAGPVDALCASDYPRYMGPVTNLDIDVVLDRELTTKDEYRALTAGVAVLDRSDVGRLLLAGEDALDLLNRLSTNELATLEVGEGAATVLTTNKGRIVDLLYVHRLQDRLVVFTSPGNQQRVAEWIDFYTFVEDVAVEDVTSNTAMLSITGLGSTAFLDGLTKGQVTSLATFGRLGDQVATVPAEIYRSDFLGVPSFDIVIGDEHGGPLFESLANEGAVPVRWNMVEAVRVQRGIPAFGKELTEDYNPHEANLVHRVSFSKGCYIGQEVITRLQTYEKVSKYLVGLQSDGEMSAPGSFLTHDGRRIGIITSAAHLPHSGAKVGLGYVRKSFVANGETVNDEAGNEMRIKVLV